jgi:hypothetical protein
MVPSFEATTPLPAVALVTPFGNSTSGQVFKHAAAHAVLLGLRVYSVVRLSSTVPTLVVFTAEMTSALDA